MTLFCSGCPVAGGVVFVTRIVHRASFASAPCGEAFAVKIEVADAVLCFRQSQVGSPFQPPACFHQIARHTCAAEVVPADDVGGDGFFLVVVIAPVGSFFTVEYPEEIFYDLLIRFFAACQHIHDEQGSSCFFDALCHRLLVVAARLGEVACVAAPPRVEAGEVVGGDAVLLCGGFFQPVAREA